MLENADKDTVHLCEKCAEQLKEWIKTEQQEDMTTEKTTTFPDSPVSLKEIRKVYDQLRRSAKRQTELTASFGKLCEAYYGCQFGEIKELENDDYIIDTLDYGTGNLSFKEFHKKMIDALDIEKQ